MASEMRGFVFSIVFIFVFATLIATIPAGLQGPENAPNTVIPIDPSLVTGFADSENYTTSSFSPAGYMLYSYVYTMSSTWDCVTDNVSSFTLGKRVLWLGLYLGHHDWSSFEGPEGQDRGGALTWSEIADDATDGAVRYSLTLDSGDSGGAFVVYWNTTEHSSVEDAWDNDELYLLHGIGFASSATADIGALLVSFLFFQLPEVPILINVLLATPIWACIVFVIWFVVKEMIPFL